MDHDTLAAVEPDGIAIQARLRRHAGKIEATAGLLVCEGESCVPRDRRRQQGCALLRRAMPRDEPRAHDDARNIGFEHERAAELFDHQHRLDRTATESAVLFGDAHREQTEIGQRTPRLGTEALLRREDLAPPLERVFLAHEARDGFL